MGLFMLKKTVCRKCCNKNREYYFRLSNEEEAWTSIDDKKWCREGKVICPWKVRPNDAYSVHIFISHDPAYWCPYILEHVI